MSGAFMDHFSGVANAYAAARPSYPDALFDWLSAQVDRRECAIDCACGNGQATLDLASHFERVIGVEASEAQRRSAPAHPNIVWRVGRSEDTSLPDGSADLLTVAQAAHWFDLESFCREVRRLLRPGGVIAVWCYVLTRVEGEGISESVGDF